MSRIPAEPRVGRYAMLEIPCTDVMGWSDGGNAGFDLAIHHPDRLAHLVTFGSNFAPDGLEPAAFEWNRTATAASFGPEMRAAGRRSTPIPTTTKSR